MLENWASLLSGQNSTEARARKREASFRRIKLNVKN
jgi:hypothetical protein